MQNKGDKSKFPLIFQLAPKKIMFIKLEIFWAFQKSATHYCVFTQWESRRAIFVKLSINWNNLISISSYLVAIYFYQLFVRNFDLLKSCLKSKSKFLALYYVTYSLNTNLVTVGISRSFFACIFYVCCQNTKKGNIYHFYYLVLDKFA